MSSIAPRHIPVLGREAVALLNPGDGGIYVDATFGAGGYSRMILDVQEPVSSASTAIARPSQAGSISSTNRPAGSRWSRTGFRTSPKFVPRRASTRSTAS